MPKMDSLNELTQWDGWSNETKLWDKKRPFHRINSPAYDTSNKQRPNGKEGYDCGCRDPDKDYDTSVIDDVVNSLLVVFLNILGGGVAALLLYAKGQLLRAIPGWVPVGRNKVPRNQFVEQEKEVEGLLVRSFQTWTDVPLFQWHHFYDWNFHIIPLPGYEYIVGEGNLFDTETDQKQSDRREGKTPNPGKKQPVIETGTTRRVECEWDCGAIGHYNFDGGEVPKLDNPGPMFNKSDWAWPMAGQQVWIAGRWIFDCGHTRENENENNTKNLFKTELHPCKAVASARWEAVKFDEHEHFCPAIQFMFFACRHGGYFNFETLNNLNYEFIVDLPELPEEVFEFPIGHSPDFPLNTILVRPRLLMKCDYELFSNAYGKRAAQGIADPQVELLPPSEPGKVPTQAKVIIPLQNLENNIDSYGVLLSLGWHDPARTQHPRIKKVVVSFNSFEPHKDHDPTSRHNELQIKFGANGRWFAVYKEILAQTRSFGLGKQVVLYLSEDEYIAVNCHGMEDDPVGEVMLKSKKDRYLENYTWDKDIDQPDNFHASRVAGDMIEEMWQTFENQNDPLGIIDPGYTMNDGDSRNPIQVSELIKLTGGPGRPLQCHLTARVTEVEDEQLRYIPDEIDYVLNYTITYYDQD